MRNNNLLAQVLLLFFLISAISLAIFSGRYIWAVKKLQHMQPQMMQVNLANNLFQALKNDSLEYSRTHADLTAVLQTWEKAHTADTTRPAGK